MATASEVDTTDQQDQIDLEGFLCLAVHATARAFDTVYRRHLKGVGLTYPQFLLLSALWEDDTRAFGALAEALHLDPSSLTPLVKRLESRGLLSRRRDRDDERRVWVELTEAGRRMEQETRHVVPAVCVAMGTTPHEQRDLVRQLHELTAELRRSH